MNDLHDSLVSLGFLPGANPTYDQLKKRWKELCQKHHPDKQGGDAEAFRRVTHAFKMLTDAEYRHNDRENAARRGQPNVRGALDVRMMIPISFEDAFFGRKLQFTYSICRFDESMQMIPVKDGDEVETDRLSVELTPNTMDGWQQLLPGQGHRCGNERGNALIIVQVLPHARFQVRGGNVYSTETLPLDVCLKGGQIETLTMYGLKPVKIKPGTRPGDEVRIVGCGPTRDGAFGMKTKGDHCVNINVAFPGQEELKVNDTWRKLGIDWGTDAKPDAEAESLMRLFERLGTERRV